MAPDQRGQVGDVVVVDVHALPPDVANGFLHVDGVPVDDDIDGEAQGAKLLFLALLEWAADLPASPWWMRRLRNQTVRPQM